jgi:hypothetical protein
MNPRNGAATAILVIISSALDSTSLAAWKAFRSAISSSMKQGRRLSIPQGQ